MKKHILSILIMSIFFLTIAQPLSAFATESNDVQTQEQDIEYNELDIEENNIQFYPVTINFILEGIEIPLKNPKILNDPSNFWSDYTVKLSSNLMYGGIDIQESIRGYQFSHYEIGGLRIESIDAIIEAKDENTTINVVYSEEIPKGGYLRKGFRNGIGLDINYLKSCAQENKIAYTDLYDNRWTLELPQDICNEISENTNSFVNANDKTLYINPSVSSVTDKQQTELTKKYGYIDSITLLSSLNYDDFKNEFILNYTSPNEMPEFEGLESNLYGINLEGKVELLATSSFNNNSTSFALNTNTNKYQLLFIGINPNNNNTTDNEELITENSNSEGENLNTNIDDKKEQPSTQISENLSDDNQKHSLDENTFVILVLSCFASGAIFTFILSLILSIRNENIEKKKAKENNDAK